MNPQVASLRGLLVCWCRWHSPGVWQLQNASMCSNSALEVEDDQVILRSSKLVKAMSLEYAPLVADIYWTRVVQYFGNKHAGKQMDLRLLWPLLDITRRWIQI